MCKRAILLDRGQVIADGPTEEVLEIYARMNRGEPPLPAPPAEEREQASGQPSAAV
jgi:ABC-type multidrug transport system ATPase subunit